LVARDGQTGGEKSGAGWTRRHPPNSVYIRQGLLPLVLRPEGGIATLRRSGTSLKALQNVVIALVFESLEITLRTKPGATENSNSTNIFKLKFESTLEGGSIKQQKSRN
jgi:hypothetical protein